MDDTTPLQDYSGYSGSTTATVTGTELHGLPLSAYASFSQIASPTTTIQCTSSATQTPSYSWAVVAYVTKPNLGAVQILGYPGNGDGIILNVNQLSYITKFTNTGSATATYQIDYNQKLDIVAVHTPQKNSLYLNGVLVAEVDISDVQQADTLSESPTVMSSGGSGSSNILLNCIAYYPTALNPEDIVRIYQANSRRSGGTVPNPFGGEDVLVSSTVHIPYLKEYWNSDEQWDKGVLFNTTVDNDTIAAQTFSGLTIAGTWSDTINIYNGDTASPIDNIVMFWEGINESIQASVDGGTTWLSVTKGTPLSNVPPGFDPTNIELNLQISFPDGEDEAYVSNLTVTGWLTNTDVSASRTLTYPAGSAVYDEYDPSMMHDLWGVDLNGGTLTIGSDASDVPLNPMTVEIWVRQGTGTAFSTTLAMSTAYLNGGSYVSPRVGEWSVIHTVLSTARTTAFTISGDVQIGKIAVYSGALTSTQINQIIKEYTGVIINSPSTSDAIGIAESSPPTTFYPYDWSISTS